MKRPLVELVGTGRYTPVKVLTNADLEKLVDTTDEWIVERTGIRERHISGPDETVAYMSKKAAEQVLEQVGIGPLDLDAIIMATASPDRLLPSSACDLQALLGAENAAAFDVQAACSGFLYALTVAEGMVSAGSVRNVLVLGAERLSTIADYTDRSTCILFGDGAGATLVRPVSNGTGRGMLASYLKSDGRLAELLYRPGGGGCHPPDEQLLVDHSYFIQMAGREVFKAAVRSMADACDKALRQAGLASKDVDVLIPHQANIRIIESTAKHAGISMKKVYVNVDRFGNTSAASIPIALDECVREGRVGPGSTVLMVAFGGGFTWASTVVRW
ncbi:MAG: 3-oxoacyl-ACP synthase [Gemmatimonadetes bacterium RBG_16_66_8]|nr:MAG: 3-oxoacyl-ACP synthase [Gemmatimonadetes bacterium RBG_16_66_8]